MACLMKYIKLPVGNSKDQIVHHCPDNPSGPPNKGMTGGLNVPRLPQFPDNTGNNLAQDDDCDKQKEDGNCDNQKEDVNNGSKQMARQKKNKNKKARVVTVEATIDPNITDGFPWFNKPKHNSDDSIYNDLFQIDRHEAGRLKNSVLMNFPFNIRLKNIVSNGVY